MRVDAAFLKKNTRRAAFATTVWIIRLAPASGCLHATGNRVRDLSITIDKIYLEWRAQNVRFLTQSGHRT